VELLLIFRRANRMLLKARAVGSHQYQCRYSLLRTGHPRPARPAVREPGRGSSAPRAPLRPCRTRSGFQGPVCELPDGRARAPRAPRGTRTPGVGQRPGGRTTRYAPGEHAGLRRRGAWPRAAIDD
jgi:hypothetical protein